jgi:hypothetical protein
MPPLSKTDFDAALHDLKSTMATKDDIRDLITHFNKSQGLQNETLKQIDIKVTAVLEMGAIRQEVENLVRELKAQGIVLDEQRIFVARPTSVGS